MAHRRERRRQHDKALPVTPAAPLEESSNTINSVIGGRYPSDC